MASFFISYARADRDWADWIYWQLKNAGHDCVMQLYSFKAGENFIKSINKAIRETDRTVCVLSPQYQLSRWTQDEWAAAYHEQKLFPVRVAEVDLEPLQKIDTYADLAGKTEQEAVAELFEKLPAVEKQPPAGSAPFPPLKRAEQTFPRTYPGKGGAASPGQHIRVSVEPPAELPRKGTTEICLRIETGALNMTVSVSIGPAAVVAGAPTAPDGVLAGGPLPGQFSVSFASAGTHELKIPVRAPPAARGTESAEIHIVAEQNGTSLVDTPYLVPLEPVPFPWLWVATAVLLGGGLAATAWFRYETFPDYFAETTQYWGTTFNDTPPKRFAFQGEAGVKTLDQESLALRRNRGLSPDSTMQALYLMPRSQAIPVADPPLPARFMGLKWFEATVTVNVPRPQPFALVIQGHRRPAFFIFGRAVTTGYLLLFEPFGPAYTISAFDCSDLTRRECKPLGPSDTTPLPAQPDKIDIHLKAGPRASGSGTLLGLVVQYSSEAGSIVTTPKFSSEHQSTAGFFAIVCPEGGYRLEVEKVSLNP